MTDLPGKTPGDSDLEQSTFTVPCLTVEGAAHSRINEQIELDSFSALKGKACVASAEQPLNEQSEDQNAGRNTVKAIPNSYKLLAFSMIIFFNTSSSFSESTLSPLKGIFREELGVTSRSLLCRGCAYAQTPNMEPSPRPRAWPIPSYLYLVACLSTTGVRLMLLSSAPSSSPWGP